MFQDLDNTLAQVLNDPAAPAELFNADVSFMYTPDKNFATAQVTVNLFLYEVKENRDLRDPTPIIEKVNGSFIRKEPPLRVDCSYIVTALVERHGRRESSRRASAVGADAVMAQPFSDDPLG